MSAPREKRLNQTLDVSVIKDSSGVLRRIKDNAARGAAEKASKTAELAIEEARNKATLDMVYPVGSIYMSVNAVSPATLFGGTWEQIKDMFLLSAGDTYTAGDTGGEAAHTLSVAETPRHNHATFIFNANNTNFDAYHADGSGGWNKATYGGRLPSGHMSWQSAAFKTAGSNYSGIGTGDFAGNTDIVGGGGAHNNMPPYLVVYVWKRTA